MSVINASDALLILRYDFLAALSISLISSRVHIHFRVATLLMSDHSAVEELGFT